MKYICKNQCINTVDNIWQYNIYDDEKKERYEIILYGKLATEYAKRHNLTAIAPIDARKFYEFTKVDVMQTKEQIKLNFRGYDITIPKGTKVSHKTALGIDPSYHFISDLSWIENKNSMLYHDVFYYGINIERKKVNYCFEVH